MRRVQECKMIKQPKDSTNILAFVLTRTKRNGMIHGNILLYFYVYACLLKISMSSNIR